MFAESLGATRHIVAALNNDIYVNTWRSPYDTTRRVPPGGYVVALRDTGGDGKADLIQRFGTTSESGSRGGTGIALRDGALYVETDSSILRYIVPPDSLLPLQKPEVIVTGLATAGDPRCTRSWWTRTTSSSTWAPRPTRTVSCAAATYRCEFE